MSGEVILVAKSIYVDGNGIKHYGYKYKSECIACGTDIFSQKKTFKNHSMKCRSCTQKTLPYLHIYNALLSDTRGKNVDLSYEEFILIIENAQCHYCGGELRYEPWSRSSSGESNLRAYQLDRKDNQKGYSKENIVPCCWSCNSTKGARFTYEEFMLLSSGLEQIRKQRTENIQV